MTSSAREYRFRINNTPLAGFAGLCRTRVVVDSQAGILAHRLASAHSGATMPVVTVLAPVAQGIEHPPSKR